MARSKLLLLILAFVCLAHFSHAFESNSELSIVEIHDVEIANQQKAEELASMFALGNEIQSIYSQIQHIRHIVANNSRETIEVFDHFDKIDTSFVCNSCQKFIKLIERYQSKKMIINVIEKTITVVCELIKIDKQVCQGAVKGFGDVLLNELITKIADPERICQRMMICPRTVRKERVKEYAQEILKDKPETFIPTPTKKSSYRILQLSDPHIDLQYEAGANAFCTQPLCCRSENGIPSSPENGAQFWGTKSHCDIPMRTFDQFLQFASKNLDVDMIIWTGDNIAHDIWHQNIETQTVNTYDITQEIMKYFPNTPVYPMFGNHEAYPADQFDTIGDGSAWLLEQLSDMWKPWLDEKALATFREKSYYSTMNSKFNVKIIALDTQVCDTANFYLIRDPTDPLQQLAWLREELYESERKNQGVFIMGHIPPGDFGCHSLWSARYRALVDRFTNIIRGQFFGHTHTDQLQVVRSFGDGSPVGSIYIAPSFTTYANLNPAFRIYEVDAETNLLLNLHQYRLDLDKWNSNTTGPLVFDEAYNILEEYNVPDMSFKSIDEIVNRIKNSTEVAETYVFNYDSGAIPRAKLTARETAHYYCLAKHSVSEDALKCLGLKAQVGDLLLFATQLLPGAWYIDKC